jgi:hypothetical protein
MLYNYVFKHLFINPQPRKSLVSVLKAPPYASHSVAVNQLHVCTPAVVPPLNYLAIPQPHALYKAGVVVDAAAVVLFLVFFLCKSVSFFCYFIEACHVGGVFLHHHVHPVPHVIEVC